MHTSIVIDDELMNDGHAIDGRENQTRDGRACAQIINSAWKSKEDCNYSPHTL